MIDATCKNKFRSKDDVSIWLVRYWQLLTGNFEPRSDKFGKFYVMNDFVSNKKAQSEFQKKKSICVNDTTGSVLDFETEREMFENVMNNFLGKKSSFEK